ncbi:Protein sym-1 [Taphrina deformans PYCC 5710]|uniref:Protein sym-1 n=1 Tax=Taphrina deformans (strain PYCC 5710 / ATCC 11124 / CBS 356.35 / IMI 108563 / JCM 9778 / NBRC 8474) TaxID=1097556 RepID=R4X9M3_TAPDE|nr:Protein sym-1 [Taphrina deformans PYCC 5710]|eukprot:CCG80934.1 Protein sym-1 [Taphrina deformans PYCC 5710]
MIKRTFGKFQPLRQYNAVLVKRPVLTSVITGTVLVSAGDALAQHQIEGTAWREHDWHRTGNMVFLRGFLHTSMILYWYRFLHTKLAVPTLSTNSRLAFHLLLDQGFFGPFNVAFFFVASGLLERKSPDQIRQKLDDCLVQTITSAWLVWVPFQFLGFRYLGINTRLAFGQIVAVFWNSFMYVPGKHELPSVMQGSDPKALPHKHLTP